MNLLECYLFCNERQHCIVYGDRFGLRATSLPFADSCSGSVQRLLLPLNRPIRTSKSFVQVSIDFHTLKESRISDLT